MPPPQEKKEQNQPSAHELVLPGQTLISIPKLMMGGVRSKVMLTWEGKRPKFEVVEEVKVDDNLVELAPVVADELQKRPLLLEHLREAVQGHKSAIIKVTAGFLVVTTAAIAGYEFGIRGGKDVREFWDTIQPHLPLPHRLKKDNPQDPVGDGPQLACHSNPESSYF